MMAESAKQIFDAAIAAGDPAERERVLRAACGGDAALAEQVRGLLTAHDALGHFLDAPTCSGSGPRVIWPTPGKSR